MQFSSISSVMWRVSQLLKLISLSWVSTIGESGRCLVGQPYPWCLQDGQPGLQSVLHMRRVSLSLAGSWSCSLLLGTCTMYITPILFIYTFIISRPASISSYFYTTVFTFLYIFQFSDIYCTLMIFFTFNASQAAMSYYSIKKIESVNLIY